LQFVAVSPINKVLIYKNMSIKMNKMQVMQQTGLHISEAALKFAEYVKTSQVLQLRLRGEEEEEENSPDAIMYEGRKLKPIHIEQKFIEKHFFVYPKHIRKDELKTLVDSGILRITNGLNQIDKGKNPYLYEVLSDSVSINLNLVRSIRKPTILDEVHKAMQSHLKAVTLPQTAERTPYFDLFLQNKNEFIELFFNVCEFAKRVHTPVTNFHRKLRPNIKLYGEPTASLDVTTMQPLLLGKILKKSIGENEYSTWINEGKDIYLMLQEKAGLENRDAAKKRFFEIAFGKPDDSLQKMFGESDWIKWVNNLKKKTILENPHHTKTHSNLAWLLQTTEVQIMYKIWKELIFQKTPFLSIHDEVMTRERDLHKAESIMRDVLSKEFEYYQLNKKASPEYESKLLQKQLDYEQRITKLREGILDNKTRISFLERRIPQIESEISRYQKRIQQMANLFAKTCERCEIEWYTPKNYPIKPKPTIDDFKYWTS
jgi:hypothetical protein